MALQLILKRRTLPSPSLIHLFSTSSSSASPADSDDPNCQPKSSSSANRADSDERNDQFKSFSSTNPPDSDNRNDRPKSPSSSSTSFSSYFSDVKSSLRHLNQSPPLPRQPRRPPSSPNLSAAAASSPSKVAFLDQIRKGLSELRIRSEASLPTNSAPPPSFLDSYNNTVLRNANASSNAAKSGPGILSLNSIRDSLSKMRSSDGRPSTRGTDRLSLKYTNSQGLKPSSSPPPPSSTILGGTEALPSSVFGKEMMEKKVEGTSAMKMKFGKTYSYVELGEKLKKLRPERKDRGEGWFSMEELNERLMRLREIEDKETESNIGGIGYKEIKQTLFALEVAAAEEAKKAKKTTFDRFDVLRELGRTPSFMMQPPKEHLVEKYFHPDNMSSAEKMKIELAKVRDEFKMSESDCGSARVQVAQLTTKIKNLSSVLHKKDKHSRKGLIAMVQRRKRLLKYLRRTDWDSYCFVLDKLGLRDNPDYKN